MLPRWQLHVKQRPERPASRLRAFILQGSSLQHSQASAEGKKDASHQT